MSARMSLVKVQTGVAGAPMRASRCAAPVNRRVIVCRAEDNPDGFIARDNSGKANMYPTMAKAFEAGSAADTATNQGANLAYAGVAGAVAVAAVAIALSVGNGAQQADFSEFSEYQSLSAYRAAFASDVGLSKPAAAPAPALE